LPDLNKVVSIVKRAGDEELKPRFRNISFSHKADGSVLTEADLASQKLIESELSKNWPDIGFLGEEMTPEEQASILKGSGSFWCLDPLDGTLNYSCGVPLYAVSLALIQNGDIVMGVIYDPSSGECFTGEKGKASRLNGEILGKKIPQAELARGIGLIDIKRLKPDLINRMFSGQRPFQSQRSIGSVALEWCWMAAGRFHVYLHGSQNLWDYAAGHLILEGAGGHSCTMEGEPVFNNTLEKRSAVCALTEDIFMEWKNYLNIPST